MMPIARRFLVVSAVLALAMLEAVAADDYVIGYAGTGIKGAPSPPVPGYVVAGLQDITASAFVNAYNAFALSSSTGDQVFPATGCPVVVLREGFLAYGSQLDVNAWLVSPFTAQGKPMRPSNLASPIVLGALNQSNFQSTTFIGPYLNASDVASFYIATSTTVDLAQCDVSVGHLTIYAKATFFVGSLSPTPFCTGSTLATLADIRSRHFVDEFNGGSGLEVTGEYLTSPCCAFRLMQGYLGYSNSPSSSMSPLATALNSGDEVVTPFFSQGGASQCPTSSSLTAPVAFGTASDGNLGPLTAVDLNRFRLLPNPPATCNEATSVWAIYAAPPGCVPTTTTPFTTLSTTTAAPPVTTSGTAPTLTPSTTVVPPTTTAPSDASCYSLNFNADYVLNDNCYAIRNNYIVQLGQVSRSINMSTNNLCGFPAYVYNFSLSYYNTTVVVASMGSFTGCSCPSQNIAFVDIDQGDGQLCMDNTGTGYCDLDVSIASGPFPCPP